MSIVKRPLPDLLRNCGRKVDASRGAKLRNSALASGAPRVHEAAPSHNSRLDKSLRILIFWACTGIDEEAAGQNVFGRAVFHRGAV